MNFEPSRAKRRWSRVFVLGVFAVALANGPPGSVLALERVILRQNEKDVYVDGRLLVESQDGGLLLQSADGVLWTIPPDQLVKRETLERPFEPLDKEALGKELLKELPAGFEVHETVHYVILHNTSKVYAEWAGSLFERLFKGFKNYWTQREFEFKEPEFPLVAIVFADQSSYAEFAHGELGDAAASIPGYYSLKTNRMTMVDLTGVAALRQPGDRRGSSKEIGAMLSQPRAERTVATIVHEATHQIAFNLGLHTRYADLPLWFCEGLAVYFETPDAKSSKGWKSIGGVNRYRLEAFRGYLARRRPNSLATLVTNSDRLRDPKEAADAYAEAWALTYFLIRQRPRQYFAYVRALAMKKELILDQDATRLDEFREAFGGDLEKLDADFLKFVAKIK